MNNPMNLSPNKLYHLNQAANSRQLFEAVHVCLCKAEALATVATRCDFENYDAKCVNDYLWALSDLVDEAQWLFERACDIQRH